MATAFTRFGAFNPEHLVSALRGTPAARTLSAPAPAPQHALPRAMARWQADAPAREAEALERATTPSRAWVDGAEVVLAQPTITMAEPAMQEDDLPTFVDLVT